MQISDRCVVSLVWSLTDASNQALADSGGPSDYLIGGEDLLPKVQEALRGQEVGFETRIQLEPEHAFGPYDAALVCFEDRALFPEPLREGMRFEGLPPGSRSTGMPVTTIYTVTEIYPSHVVLDGNHPLAGMALRLQLKVVDVRGARPEELQAGSAGQAMVAIAGRSEGASPLH